MAKVLRLITLRLMLAREQYAAALRLPAGETDSQVTFRIAAAEVAFAEREARQKVSRLTQSTTD